jgi:hypothetical protein
VSAEAVAANAAMIRLTGVPPFSRPLAADTKCSNPVCFGINGWHGLLTKYADGGIVLEFAEATYNIGGRAEFDESTISFEKLAKYCLETDDRIVRMCEVKGATFDCCMNTKQVRVVFGRAAPDNGENFGKVKGSILCAHVCDDKLPLIFTRAINVHKLRRRIMRAMTPIPAELLMQLVRMHTNAAE